MTATRKPKGDAPPDTQAPPPPDTNTAPPTPTPGAPRVKKTPEYAGPVRNWPKARK